MLQGLVAEVGADIGLAFDGMQIRLIVVDNKGEIVDGDILYICGTYLNKNDMLNNTVVATVMSNIGLDIA